ncbi:MAG: hypothetical protein ACTSQJ_04140 [Promethearchaeota archaeon]
MEDKEKSKIQIEYISTSGVYKTPFTLIILAQLFFGGIVIILVNLWFWDHLYFLLTGKQFFPLTSQGDWYDWILLPLNIFGNIFLFAFSIILFSSVIYKILNKLHPPREGVFEKGSKDWKYMTRRYWTSYFPIWLSRALPLPWADIICYKFFGTHIGKSVVAYEGYIDPEFVEIGDNTMTSLHICIFSHLIYHDKVIIKRVKIGQNCIVGPQTIISPGTIMKEEAILGANSYTWIDQVLEGNLIHVGTPVSMNFPIQTLEQSKEKVERLKKVKLLDDIDSSSKIKNGGAKK